VHWRHIGELVDKPGKRTLLHNVKTKEGQSGSPVYFIDSKAKEVIVIGIHSKASTQKAGANVARMVTSDMIDDFTRWAVESGASAPLMV
jgi:V8-like Glu-specific endopeptidase